MRKLLIFFVAFLAAILYPLYGVMTRDVGKEIKDDVFCSACNSDLLRTLESLTYQEFVSVNGVSINVNVAGPENAEKLVLFIHGFPETGLLNWKHQIVHFAQQGYRVIAPDTRGTNTSEKGDVYKCNAVRSSEDMIALIKHYGYEKAFVVGHDWGAIVAWLVGMRFPEHVEKLGILNVPHPGANMYTWTQIKMSWYIFFFQTPVLPEMRIYKDDFAFLIAGLASSNKNSYSLEELERYKKAWNQPDAITSMVNFYRHIVRNPNEYPKVNVTVPTLILWGVRDMFLEKRLASESLDWCNDGKVKYLEASHWSPHDQAQTVNEELQKFFEK